MIQDLGKFLASKKFKPYEWGVNDCNTFVVDWIDHYYQKDWNGQLQFDYSNQLGAIRYHKKLPFDASEFMYMAGYDQTTATPETGDVLLQKMGAYYASWIVLLDDAYTFQQQHGLCSVAVNILDNYTTWRHP